MLISSLPCSVVADGSDSSSAGRRLRPLLAASPRHRHVGGVWRLPAGRRVLRLPHHRSLPVVRELVHQPRPLRLPVPELPAGVPAGLHPPLSVHADATQQGCSFSDRELFQYAFLHQLVRSTAGAGRPHGTKDHACDLLFSADQFVNSLFTRSCFCFFPALTGGGACIAAFG